MTQLKQPAIGKILFRVLIAFVLLALTAVCVLPFWIMLVNATRTNNEILSGSSLIPGTAIADNFQTLVAGKLDAATLTRGGGLDIPRGFFNSAVIAFCSVALSGYLSALTAFGFAIHRFPLRKFLWGAIVAVIMIPSSVSLIGFFKLVSSLNLLDSYWALILPAGANAFAVFFLRQYIIASIPTSIIEAARMESLSELGIFHKIILPLVAPGIATISIMGFLGSWNNYLGPLIVLNDKSLFTLPLMIQQLNTSLYNRDFGAMYMGVALSVIPILIMFAFFQRTLIEGVTTSGMKE